MASNPARGKYDLEIDATVPSIRFTVNEGRRAVRSSPLQLNHAGGSNRRPPPPNCDGLVTIRSTCDAPPPRPSTAAPTGRPPPPRVSATAQSKLTSVAASDRSFSSTEQAKNSTTSIKEQKRSLQLQFVRTSCSRKLLNEESKPNRVLHVSVQQQLSGPITEKVLREVFSRTGRVEKIIILSSFPTVEALVQYQFSTHAIIAWDQFHERPVYDDGEVLRIQFAALDCVPSSWIVGKGRWALLCGLMNGQSAPPEPKCVVLVTICHQVCPITEEFLYEVFSEKKKVEKIVIVRQYPTVQALVQFSNTLDARFIRLWFERHNTLKGGGEMSIQHSDLNCILDQGNRGYKVGEVRMSDKSCVAIDGRMGDVENIVSVSEEVHEKRGELPSSFGLKSGSNGGYPEVNLAQTKPIELESIHDMDTSYFTLEEPIDTNGVESSLKVSEVFPDPGSETIVNDAKASENEASYHAAGKESEITLNRKGISTAGYLLVSGDFVLPHPDKVYSGGEDAYFIAGKNWIGVADGVGKWSEKGINAGIYARELMKTCEKIVSDCDSIPLANQEEVIIQSALKAHSPGPSTISAAYCDSQALHITNIGDSGFIVIRNGTVHQKTSPRIFQHVEDDQVGLVSAYRSGNVSLDVLAKAKRALQMQEESSEELKKPPLSIHEPITGFMTHPQKKGVQEIYGLLEQQMSPTSDRSQIWHQLQHYSQYSEFNNYLAFILVRAEGKPVEVRQAAGLLLKNNLRASFKLLGPPYQQYLRNELLPCLGAADRHIRSTAGTIISVLVQTGEIAEWPELLQTLVMCFDSKDLNHMECARDALSKICEEVPQVLDSDVPGLSERPVNIMLHRLLQFFQSPNALLRKFSLGSVNPPQSGWASNSKLTKQGMLIATISYGGSPKATVIWFRGPNPGGTHIESLLTRIIEGNDLHKGGGM